MKVFRKSFFITFLSSSLILVLINIITLAIVFYISNEDQFELQLDQVSVQIEKSLDIIDSRIEEMSNMALRISQDSLIVKAIRITSPLSSRDYATLLQLETRFQHYNQQTSFINQIFIILKRSDIVISDFGTSPDINIYAENFFTYATMDYNTWKMKINLWDDNFTIMPAAKINTLENQIEAITVRFPITIGLSSPNAAFIALIPVERIDYYYQDLISKNCILSLYDKEGTLLYQSSPDSIEGPHEILTSESQHLDISLAVPHSYINTRLKTNRIAIIAILAINILIITGLALILARRNSLPLETLIQKISNHVPEQSKPIESSYQWLEESLERIVGDRIDTKATVAMQKAHLRIGFYAQLINGTFIDEQDIHEYLDNVNLPLPEGSHFVALFSVVPLSLPNQPDTTAQRLILNSYLAKYSFPEWHHHQTSLGEVLVIPAQHSYEDFLTKIQIELYRSTGVVSLLCLGRPRESLLELKDSYEEARRTLVTSTVNITEPTVKYYTIYSMIPHAYHYDDKDRELLLHAVYSGEMDQVTSVINQFFEKNRPDKPIPTTGLFHFFTDLTTTVCGVIQKKGQGLEGIPHNYNRYLEIYTSREDFYNRIITLLTPICQYLNGNKKSHNSGLSSEIQIYLNDHFLDPMLCQSSVAQHFSLNPQYLSRFFREQTGESFSSCLEKLRMKEAMKLMNDNENSSTLKEIAAQAGYLSWNSFYKAFKRKFNMTPGEYRKRVSQET